MNVLVRDTSTWMEPGLSGNWMEPGLYGNSSDVPPLVAPPNRSLYATSEQDDGSEQDATSEQSNSLEQSSSPEQDDAQSKGRPDYYSIGHLGHLFGEESTPPRRALLLCGFDSDIPTLDALAFTLGHEPGWIVESVGVSLPGNLSRQELSRQELTVSSDPALRICINAVPDWVDSLAGYSRCSDMWVCGFGMMATAIMLALSNGSLGSLDGKADSIGVTGLACVGMELRDSIVPEDTILQAASLVNGLDPLLVVHGLEDKITPPDYIRRVVGACPSAKADSLRLLGGAGHDLYADPRVVALLIGWMDKSPL